MGIRDQEIARLEKYAQGLGLKVEYRRYKKGHPSAELVNDTNSDRIVMYTWSRKSKMQIVLDFVHELGHHLGWIYNNRKDNPFLLEALSAEDSRVTGSPPIPKEQRRLIYECEKNDAQYRDQIIKETNIKIPPLRLKLDKKMDMWIYKHYYRTGDSPTLKEIKKKEKEMYAKLKSKN